MMASILKPRLKSMCKIIWCNAIRCFHATQYHTTNYQFLRWKIVPSKICSIDVQDARASDTMQSDASAKNWYHAKYRFSELKDITIFKPGVSMSKEHLILQCNRMILWKSISYYKSISGMKAKYPQIWSTNVQSALDIAMQTDVSVKNPYVSSTVVQITSWRVHGFYCTTCQQFMETSWQSSTKIICVQKLVCTCAYLSGKKSLVCCCKQLPGFRFEKEWVSYYSERELNVPMRQAPWSCKTQAGLIEQQEVLDNNHGLYPRWRKLENGVVY
jgi:hypothetical protein